MKNVLLSTVLLVSACAMKHPIVEVETDLGSFRMEVYEKKAPITTTNFLSYVDENVLAGGSFYRTVTMSNQPKNDVKIEVIQGGLGFADTPKRKDPISHETTQKTGILHKDGTVSMARLEPGSASSEIFICIGPQPELDFGGKRNPDGQGFAAFGKVISGMGVVRNIHTQPNEKQMISKPVTIRHIRRVK